MSIINGVLYFAKLIKGEKIIILCGEFHQIQPEPKFSIFMPKIFANPSKVELCLETVAHDDSNSKTIWSLGRTTIFPNIIGVDLRKNKKLPYVTNLSSIFDEIFNIIHKYKSIDKYVNFILNDIKKITYPTGVPHAVEYEEILFKLYSQTKYDGCYLDDFFDRMNKIPKCNLLKFINKNKRIMFDIHRMIRNIHCLYMNCYLISYLVCSFENKKKTIVYDGIHHTLTMVYLLRKAGYVIEEEKDSVSEINLDL